MDHCYTPLTSPSQKHPVPSDDNNDPDCEIDDLAHTLSILDGPDKIVSQPTLLKTTPAKVVHKIIQKDTKPNLIQNDKVSLINKVNKLGVNKVYKGVKSVLNKTSKVIKKVVPTEESDDTDDNDNDSDFELNDIPKTKVNKRTYKRRPKIGDNEHPKQKAKSRKNAKTVIKTPKPVEPKIEPAPSLQQPPAPAPIPAPEPVKSPEVKKPPPKKEKKVPKPPIDDGIALFSTPDIIRRVGTGKPGEKHPEKHPEAAEPPKIPKPAKIEDRSRSDSARTSLDSKTKLPQRLSLDSKLSSPEKIKPEHKERRNSDKKVETISAIENALMYSDNIVPVNENTSNITPMTQSVFNDMPVKNAVVPNVDEINSIMHTNAPMQPVGNASINNETQMGLEAPVLDIDHAILDNINADELMSEDILYQVAKLVENPDLQNAIDTTLVDGSLNLDPALQQQISQPPVQTQIQEPVQPIIQVMKLNN